MCLLGMSTQRLVQCRALTHHGNRGLENTLLTFQGSKASRPAAKALSALLLEAARLWLDPPRPAYNSC